MNPSDLQKIAAKLPLSKSVLEKNGPAFGYPRFHSAEETPTLPAKAKRIRHKAKLNKTELAFFVFLKNRYEWVGVQCITLELADMCRYTPDFLTHTTDLTTFWEVKGPFMREDSWIKLKVAARTYPWWRFVLAQKHKDGHWTETTIQP